ncbi:MAG: BLUF domain-containing protein [Methylococcaceae bacterium]
MSLHCLIYTSVAKQKMTDNCLKSFLDRTRPINSAVTVTGMLLYIDPYFVQILEGDIDDVCESFVRISKDPIHHKVSLILKKPITERNFANLAMGFNKVSEKDIDSFVSLEAFYKSESFRKQPKEIIELLEMFKNETLF